MAANSQDHFRRQVVVRSRLLAGESVKATSAGLVGGGVDAAEGF